MKKSVEERFWEKVDRSGGEEACWVWMAHKDVNGFGQFSIGKRLFPPHRLVYEWQIGPIPEATRVTHKCCNHSCVNPNHLTLETIKHEKEFLAKRFWENVDKGGECWIWKGFTSNGKYYGQFHFGANGKELAHRMAYKLTFGSILKRMWVLHRCDNPPCVRPDHLFLGTSADNQEDMAKKGRSASGNRNGSRKYPEKLSRGDKHWTRVSPEKLATGKRNGTWTKPEKRPCGEKHGRAKLTYRKVEEIRRKYATGKFTQRQLAIEYGVYQGTVWQIIHRYHWSIVNENLDA